jgi:hypothetical protein
MRGGLMWMDHRSNTLFSPSLRAREARQKQILDSIAYPDDVSPEDAQGVEFFSRMCNLVRLPISPEFVSLLKGPAQTRLSVLLQQQHHGRKCINIQTHYNQELSIGTAGRLTDRHCLFPWKR